MTGGDIVVMVMVTCLCRSVQLALQCTVLGPGVIMRCLIGVWWPDFHVSACCHAL